LYDLITSNEVNLSNVNESEDDGDDDETETDSDEEDLIYDDSLASTISRLKRNAKYLNFDGSNRRNSTQSDIVYNSPDLVGASGTNKQENYKKPNL